MKTITLIALLIIPILGFSQSGSEIFLLDMQIKGDAITLSKPVNITNQKGYDNQPFFAKNQPLLYYTTYRDADNAETKVYNYQTHTSSFFTNKPDKEFSPTITPDGQFISCIIQRKSGAQDLGKYPLNGGEPIILVNNLKVGYHAWIDNDRLLLYILDDSIHQSLQFYNLLTKENKLIANNPGRSLCKMPGQNAMSFIDKTNPKAWVIKRLDIATMQISEIGTALPEQEYMTWTRNGLIIMSDGTSLFSLAPGRNNHWQKINFIHDNPAIKGITRLAVNNDDSKIAIVVKE